MKSFQAQFTKILLTVALTLPAFVHAEQESAPVFVDPFPQIQKGKCMFGNDMDGPEAFNRWAKSLAPIFNSSAKIAGTLMVNIRDWDAPDCTFNDGRPRLSALLSVLSSAFEIEPDKEKRLQRIMELKAMYPNSPLGVLAEANYWSSYAWHARGHGYSSSVTPEGWRLFHERMEKAEQVLAENKAAGDVLPNWYELMLEVKGALGRSEEDKSKIFYEGAKKYPTYLPLYFQMANYIHPLWGGSWKAVDDLVTWSVNNTKDTEGQTLYARIYWSVGQSVVYRDNLFTVSLAKWPKMRAGFEDLMTRHPKSKWNLNNFAMFACHAGDKKTFLSLRKKMADDIVDKAWPSTVSLELCESKFGYKK
ncbi:hypothetical protein ACO0LM_09305 [Undibacterium sp. Di26W]|uniref:hypothetical protein n=1 Tax=Undibacterium sp. Di26W TaxID=3413035 RepID=UPI003BF12DC1